MRKAGIAGIGLVITAAALTFGAAVALADTEMGPDGLPKDIPAPGSKPPTTDEWNAMTKEVTVKNSSAYHCETKMVREWLRVTCYPYDKWTLKDVKTTSSEGQQAFVGMFGPKASVVVQVIKNKKYVARYTWGPDNSTRDLTVNWATGAPRPTFAFN